jgi:glutamate dehydrogenase (NADP+)
VLKFLGFEQTFKNALTGLPMGGGKGGSDFDARGKSDNEVMRFAQAFMIELWRHIGEDTDVPAGDLGVGGREIGYLFGMYKKLSNTFTGVLTGKGLDFGGSLIRTEATGYGATYFAQEMLATKGEGFQGKVGVVSGAGNVALHVVEKVAALGGKIVAISDYDGTIVDMDGIDGEKLNWTKDLIFNRKKPASAKGGFLHHYVERYPGAKLYSDKAHPWFVKCDMAFPCAAENTLDGNDAKTLLDNGCKLVVEGANMPSTPEAVEAFLAKKILFAPGKASNAGGVATSGLEMAQNAMHLSWTAAEVDHRLHEIMVNIHKSCVEHGKDEGFINYVKGANIAGFIKVANAMLAQGVV